MATIRDRLRTRTKTGKKIDPVSTPEWVGLDGEVFVSSVTALAMDRWYERASEGNGRALYVAMFACDKVGNRLFNDEDASWLGEEEFSVVDRIYCAGMMLNRNPFSSPSELTKNSTGGTDAGDSPSS